MISTNFSAYSSSRLVSFEKQLQRREKMSLHRSSRKLAAAVAVATLGISPLTFALDNVWTGATSDAWNEPNNWSLGRVPTNQNGATTGDTFDDAVINSTAVVPLI